MPNLVSGKYNTDKSQIYLDTYEELFSSIKDNDLNILELGVFGGGSLELWLNYFSKAKIVGADIEHVDVVKSDRVKFHQGDQKDIKFLESISKENAPSGFDIIIDDASHFGHETFVTFIYLFKNFLKSGGIYVIEDWGTGYWPHFPDGRNLSLDEHHASYHLHNNTDYKFKSKGIRHNRRRFMSHDYGMVGVVKQLVDEVAISDATDARYTNQQQKDVRSLIKSVTFKSGQVVVIKN
jgi:SAM-dependent methyltransferase